METDIKGDALTTTTAYDPMVKTKAYEMYLTTALDLTDIAITLELPKAVVATWSSQGAWFKRKQDVETELFKTADAKYKRLIMEQRVSVVERHLKVCKQLEDVAAQIAESMGKDDKTVARVLKDKAAVLEKLAKALASSAGVSQRAAAITDTPFGDQNQRQGLPALIIVGARPEVPMGKTIEMEEVK